MSKRPPNVTVLMATWNGELWVSEQVKSIFAQRNCNVQLVVSDDHSTDDTLSILKGIALNNNVTLLCPRPERFGSANKNFIHLILSANVDSADYVSFSDQDDIWFDNKLQRAIECIDEDRLDGYSSNVIAFWEDGRSVLLKKSGAQKKYDYLFESAGPGCTFVMKKSRFLELRNWVKDNEYILKNFAVHDWFVYAYARSMAWKWFVDDIPGMRYRQHPSNEIGANVGIYAAKSRFSKFIKSEYLNHSIVIGELTKQGVPVVESLKRFSFVDVFYLIFNAGEYRRRYSEVWALRVLLLAYWIYKGFNYVKK